MTLHRKNQDTVWRLSQVSFRYGNGPDILKCVDLELTRGKVYGILGPNGSGKTTLLYLLCGLNTPTTGKVEFLGAGIDRYTKRDIAKRVAMVPQDFQMRFAFTVRQAVEMGRHPHTPRFSSLSQKETRLVQDVMQELDILALSDRPVTMLSGGEKQRVAAARALVQAGDALLLDEATSNLDIFHSLSILSVVRKRAVDHNLTVVAAVHDINLATLFCDQFIFLHNGEVAAQGPPAHILTHDLLQKIYGVEAKVRYDEFTSAPTVSFRMKDWLETGDRKGFHSIGPQGEDTHV